VTLKLVHTFGKHAGAVLTLNKEVVRFGRSPELDVVFDPEFDRDASGHHAEARRHGTSWLLVDLKSRNGTFVNGERVADQRTLASGDEVTFGLHGPRVRFEFGMPSMQMLAPSSAVMPPRSAMPAAAMPASAMAASAMAASAMPAPPQAPRAGQRVGQRTIAALISSAVNAARGGGGSKMNTRELAAYVDRQVGAATAKQRRATRVLAGLLFTALLGLGALLVWSQWSSDEIDRLRGELANLSPNDPRRKQIEGRLGALHPPNASFGRNLYDQSKKGIFMLASGGQGFCTAFAVKPSVLATNAHCVLAAQHNGGTIVALENEGHGAAQFAVVDMHAHPGYRDNDAHALTPDVGIVNIAGKSATVLTMATKDELAAMGAGDDVYLIGFPGRLMDTQNPAATFLAAHIGRITGNTGRPGAYADAWLVQHDAPTTHGTSGSPIFNGKGHVVAVNAGGYLEGDQETVAGRKTEVVKASPYKFGMRIDLINAILR
jgi:pSer/pThr/pTyr-binding forkhead associated (FHA) protein/V8-like Glu-specific endopeptidase